MRSMPTASWMGFSATTSWIVEQLGLAMMPRFLILRDRVRVDLGHDQRNVVLVAELGGVVDDDATGRGRLRRVLARDFGARGKQPDIQPG